MRRAKPDAKSDDFGAVWTQVRRLLRFLEACKTDAESDDFGAVWTLSDPVVRLRAEAEKKLKKTTAD